MPSYRDLQESLISLRVESLNNTFQRANNNGTDQAARMRGLV